MEILLAITFTLAGLAIGSFLNVCIDRLPARKSLVSPPSHCDACQHPISPADNIPLVSYLWLRGRCRYCGAHIPFRVWLVEAITGLLFLLAFWRYILSPAQAEYATFAITVFWGCVFLVIIFIDWEHQLILNKITYPAAIVAIILLGVDSFITGVSLFPGRLFIPETSLFSGLISGGVLLVIFLLITLLRPGSMGMGDAKLVTLIGLVCGFPLMIIAMLIGVILGGAVAIVLLVMKKKGRKDVMPYGAFLGIGPIIALLFANELISWYLH